MPSYGHYKSSSSGTTGCVKEFVSKPSESIMFPPQVSYDCDLCKNTHGFRLWKTYWVNTPSNKKQFDAMCKANHIETEVEVPGAG